MHLKFSVCGQSNQTQLIEGGKLASEKEWPWVASLRRTENDQHFCGAVAIDEYVFLTAAHCLVKYVISLIASGNNDNEWPVSRCHFMHAN